MWLVGTTERLDGLRACIRDQLGPPIGHESTTKATTSIGIASVDAASSHASEHEGGGRPVNTPCTHVDGTGQRLPCRSSSMVALDPEVRELIRASNRLDAALHARARELFEQRCGE